MFYEKRVFCNASEHDSSVEGWSQRYRQIGRGNYAASFEFMSFAEITITRECIGRAVTQETMSPPGKISFIFPIRADGGWRVNGHEEANNMTALREGETELLTVVGEESELISVTLPVEYLGLEDCLSQVRTRNRVEADYHLVDWFRSLLYLAETNCEAEADLQKILPAIISERLLDIYPGLSVSGIEMSGKLNSVELFRRARDILRSFEYAPATLADLAGCLDVSAERIRSAIRDCAGMSAASWLQQMRLEGARRELLNRQKNSVSVTDVAMRWGFFHLGRFSQYYRNLYGETPSSTLEH